MHCSRPHGIWSDCLQSNEAKQIKAAPAAMHALTSLWEDSVHDSTHSH